MKAASQAVAECLAQPDPLTGGRAPLPLRTISISVTRNVPRSCGQLVMAVKGIGEACRALDFPDRVRAMSRSTTRPTAKASCRRPRSAAWACCLTGRKWRGSVLQRGEVILHVGASRSNRPGHLGQSVYLRDIHGRTDGPPPPVDLAHEKRVGDFVRRLIRSGVATSCHDISDGGLAVAVAEMAITSASAPISQGPVEMEPFSPSSSVRIRAVIW